MILFLCQPLKQYGINKIIDLLALVDICLAPYGEIFTIVHDQMITDVVQSFFPNL